MQEIYKNYRAFALRTLSEKTFLDAGPNYATSNQLHGIIGVVTEIRELDTDPSQQEEISDIAWFLNLTLDSLDVDFGPMLWDINIKIRAAAIASNSVAVNQYQEKMRNASIHLLDCLKASIFYGRTEHKNIHPTSEKLSWQDTVKNDCRIITESLCQFAAANRIDVGATLEKNIAKLKIRYPDKFNTDLASNRDTGKELKMFEENDSHKIILEEKSFDNLVDILSEPAQIAPELKELMETPTSYVVDDEWAAEINGHPSDEFNPSELESLEDESEAPSAPENPKADEVSLEEPISLTGENAVLSENIVESAPESAEIKVDEPAEAVSNEENSDSTDSAAKKKRGRAKKE